MHLSYSVVKKPEHYSPAAEALLQIKQAGIRASKQWQNQQALNITERAKLSADVALVRRHRELLRGSLRLAFTHSVKRRDGLVASISRSESFLGEYRQTLIGRMRLQVRDMRIERRTIQPSDKELQVNGIYIHTQRIGLVHTKPGSILKYSMDLKKRRVLQSKKPTSAVKHVGIEIEFCSASDSDELTEALARAGLDRYVTLKGDGSVIPDSPDCECERCPCPNCGDIHDCECSSSEFGHEINIIASQRRFAEVVKRVCAVLDAHGAYVNKTCGLHVHLDIRKRDAKTVFANLVRSYPVLAAMVPRQRRQNSFCAAPRTGEFNPNAYSGRYWAINPDAIETHNTVEVRIHSGTTNAMKIIRWTRLLVAIAECGTLRALQYDAETLFPRLELSDTLKSYILSRIEKFRHSVNSDLNERAA
jgi:hypothetical protein